MPNDWQFKTCPQCLQKKRFKRAKEKTEKQFLKEDEEDIFLGVPIQSEDCIKFRYQTLGIEARVRGFYGIHHNSCRACQEFLARYKEAFPPMKGVNLWASEKQTEISEEEKELNRILREELT